MRVLVVGGTGGFGLQICRNLIEDGHAVTAAGRDDDKGRGAERILPGLRFLRMDRDCMLAADIEEYDIIVDAAGPFQDQPARLALACIAAGRHYVDISDSREFCRRMVDLDRKARQSGSTIVTGASSTPALSDAVVRELASGMGAVTSADIAISASNRAAFGRSVLLSMLSSAGRVFSRSDGTSGISMTGPRRLVIERDDEAIIDRTVLEVETPDQDHLSYTPHVRFHAGGEMRLHNLAMQAIAFMVKRGLVPDGTVFLSLANLARSLTGRRGSGLSAMEVSITGDLGDQNIRRRWTLIARNDMGPLIPALVVPLVVKRISEGRLPSGAMAATGFLCSKEILSRMPANCVDTRVEEQEITALYPSVMTDHDRLHPEIRSMHAVTGIHTASGRASVRRGRSPLASLICTIFGFPPEANDIPVRVEMERRGETETWTRTFGDSRFLSVLSAAPEGVVERFGPFRFAFRLIEKDGDLRMMPSGWTAFGVPMPKFLMPSGIARESAENGRFTFDVPIVMPLVGTVVHYRGWLTPDEKQDT